MESDDIRWEGGLLLEFAVGGGTVEEGGVAPGGEGEDDAEGGDGKGPGEVVFKVEVGELVDREGEVGEAGKEEGFHLLGDTGEDEDQREDREENLRERPVVKEDELIDVHEAKGDQDVRRGEPEEERGDAAERGALPGKIAQKAAVR